jgi:hypothetical protein
MKWPLVAAFGVIAGALAFGAWSGFPIFSDAWVALIVRERGALALAADSPDRPVHGWLLQALVSSIGFGRIHAAIFVLLFWPLFAWQIARLWRRVFPQRASLSWLPAMLALSPIVVRSQFMSLTMLLPPLLPVMIGLEALLQGLGGTEGRRARRLWAAGVIACAAAATSEYGVAVGIACSVAAIALLRPRLSVSLISGAVAGAVIFSLSADPTLRPDTSVSRALPDLLAHPARPLARAASGLWYGLFGAYGDAAGRVDLDSLSKSSILAAGLGLIVSALAVIAVRGREVPGARSPRATLAMLLAVAAGILPVVLAGRPASIASSGIDPISSRFLLPILPFAVCVTAGMVATLANARGFVAGTALLAFLCGDAAWREAFEARRAQRRMDALGAALRPLVAASSGITLAIVPDEPWLEFPPVVVGRATVGWSAEQARRVWIMPRRLAPPMLGSRVDCRIPADVRIPRVRHSVERAGPLERVVWVPRLSTDAGGVELEPYCIGSPGTGP